MTKVARLGPSDTLTADTALFESGLHLDSATALELLLAIEKEFGVELDPEAMLAGGAMRNVGTLAAFVSGLLKA